MYCIGIIPARGGSKGVPLKNIKTILGRPLIEYSIESALASGVLDKIIVSTDSAEIASVCSKFNDIRISMRPPSIATDTSPTESALLHVCDELFATDGIIPDAVITLEPTSPLRSPNTISKCVELLKSPNIGSVVGVTETYNVFGDIKQERFVHLIPNQPRRRQDRNPLYKESSTIYGTLTGILREKSSVIGVNPYPLIIPKVEAFDINDEMDFAIVEAVMNYMRNL